MAKHETKQKQDAYHELINPPIGLPETPTVAQLVKELFPVYEPGRRRYCNSYGDG